MKALLLITTIAVSLSCYGQKKETKSLKDTVKDLQKLTEQLQKKQQSKKNTVVKNDTIKNKSVSLTSNQNK